MDPLHGVAPGDMFLSIAKALARRREPVCHAPAGPVDHATVAGPLEFEWNLGVCVEGRTARHVN